ncbi:MAG TPA: diaminopimelate decarboxylase [Verrucomicrobiota bacterium]|jgi:diaminopimelate decarboxylase|nr:diaminopimelate decarboxylase [Verrucomicrobiota bacterium]OQB92131.1 MAG: Diaminopimelate decarboxylase [Verrucomicrobia bacterium ADurb.Bin118]HPY30805.1 diaminopimelate decarboxylase [Verrucomicrobiota bacterium]HQB17219.1 diaminopimelate decarboxylase [Verrucomicrobiota bacterium]
MHQFHYRGDRLYCEAVRLESLAKRFGTPLYVYSHRTLVNHFQKLGRAMAPVDHLICYAVKSNSNQSVLRTLANLGSGFDIVSEGELHRVIQAGGDPRKCVFAGAGKTAAEIEFALRQKVYCLNAESEPELERINRIAARRKTIAPVAVRVNPNVAVDTHAKITTGTYEDKFGIAFDLIEGVYARAAKLKHLRLRGVQMHIGSQITKTGPFENAVRKMLPLVRRLTERHGLEFFSIGGGLGILYQFALVSGPAQWWRSAAARGIITPAAYAARLLPLLKPLGLRILLEPGRFISGNSGVLITRVEYVKRTGRKNFVIVDAAMNDLIRPAFYDAYHEIVPLTRRRSRMMKADVVGGVCESGDFFCKDRLLPHVAEGDYLALMSAGAYGFVMASNYNSRALTAEVLVRDRQAALVRERQPLKEIWAGERIAPWLQ